MYRRARQRRYFRKSQNQTKLHRLPVKGPWPDSSYAHILALHPLQMGSLGVLDVSLPCRRYGILLDWFGAGCCSEEARQGQWNVLRSTKSKFLRRQVGLAKYDATSCRLLSTWTLKCTVRWAEVGKYLFSRSCFSRVSSWMFFWFNVTLPIYAQAVVDEPLCVSYDTTLSSGRSGDSKLTIFFTFTFRFCRQLCPRGLTYKVVRRLVLQLTKGSCLSHLSNVVPSMLSHVWS